MHAHHSMLLYDAQRLVTISGELTDVYFGNPHSRITVSVVGDAGVEEWVVVAQDPADAERFGYYEALAGLQVGQRFSFIGWPHRRNDGEMLGHLMLDGDDREIELIPRSGYVRPPLYAAMDRAATDPRLQSMVEDTDPDLPLPERLRRWIWSGDPVSRAAAEVQWQRARLIGIGTVENAEFPGVPEYLRCQADAGFSEMLSRTEFERIPANEQQIAFEFIQVYNRVLAKYWELHRTSCGA